MFLAGKSNTLLGLLLIRFRSRCEKQFREGKMDTVGSERSGRPAGHSQQSLNQFTVAPP